MELLCVILLYLFDFDFQDDTYTESYISTIGVDFVSIFIQILIKSWLTPIPGRRRSAPSSVQFYLWKTLGVSHARYKVCTHRGQPSAFEVKYF